MWCCLPSGWHGNMHVFSTISPTLEYTSCLLWTHRFFHTFGRKGEAVVSRDVTGYDDFHKPRDLLWRWRPRGGSAHGGGDRGVGRHNHTRYFTVHMCSTCTYLSLWKIHLCDLCICLQLLACIQVRIRSCSGVIELVNPLPTNYYHVYKWGYDRVVEYLS